MVSERLAIAIAEIVIYAILLPVALFATSAIRTHTARFLHVPNLLALALAIVGGVFLSSDDRLQQTSGQHFAQMGLSIFMAIFVVYTIICFATLFALEAVFKSERTIIYGLTMAIPFLFLRILYATLAVFEDNNEFAIVNGSATIQLCMAVLMEMAVVVIYCGIGIFVPEREVERRKEHQRSKTASI
ncbi:MAG: hypothetical protein Q9205_006057 [Flavoplaca limonia]